MKTYEIPFQFIGETVVTVEAEDIEMAIERAYNELPQNSFGHAEYYAGEWYITAEDEDRLYQED